METTESAISGNEIRLAPVLDIRVAAPLHRALLQHRGQPLTLDGRDVERLGGQCAAILISAARSWAADGQPFALREASPGLIDGLRLLGIEDASVGLDTSESADAPAP